MLHAPLDVTTIALLIIDIQERLTVAMAPDVATTVQRNTITLATVAAHFDLPIVVSEQYPKGLGRTTPAVAQALEAARNVCTFEKVEFAACAAPAWSEAVGPSPRSTWIVVGMETHVCVFQTVRALRIAGHQVIVIADAVASRTADNWRIGLDLCRQTGATIASTETVVFDLLGKAGTDDFRALAKLVR